MRQWLLVATAVLFGVLVAVFDYWTGSHFTFAHFYLIPIMVGAWCAGRTVGIVIAVLSAFEWYFAVSSNVAPVPASVYWNTITKLAVYVSLAVVVAMYREALRREKQLARTDALTGAANARTFYEQAAIELRRAGRTEHAFTIAYVDLDNFKQVNDEMGHPVGDEVLRVVVSTMLGDTRVSDVVARIGGDEFVLFLPDTDTDGASMGLAKLQSSIHERMGNRGWPVTASIGAVTYLSPPENVSEIIQRADRRLYEAKEAGKNRIVHETV